ncbi:phosphoribosylamine--glycine ligase [Anaerobranca gottschalkii]|nr:phosphoribosylamine--glycine ligase [Anaerobranca gottschalkii]
MVIGGGGREHAIIDKLLESPKVQRVYWADTKVKKVPDKVEMTIIDSLDFPALGDFAEENGVDFTIVGPELPLTEGIVDYFLNRGLLIFGPDKRGAMLEGSKTFAKGLMLKYGVPTGKHVEIKDLAHGKEIIENWGTPIVFKLDGLAGGKGVVIPQSPEEAYNELEELIRKNPQQKIFAEEYLQGEEISYMVLVSKNSYLPLVPSRDYKRVYDGNKGSNTGGMGSVAYKGLISKEEKEYIEREIIQKTLKGLDNEGIQFTGILYAGLMMTNEGPKVLEFNTRFGDPEAQSILQLIQGDLAELLYGACQGNLPEELPFKDGTALTLVLASEGYPGEYKTGYEIKGIDEVSCKVFQGGTEYRDGKILTAGGRVLNLTVVEDDVDKCREILYKEGQKITFLGKYFRTDIGL